MKWYKITLSKAQIDKGQGRAIQAAFKEIYEEENAPEDMALFSGAAEDGGRCYYFSPAAARHALIVLSFYTGARCEAPESDSVELEQGASDAKARLFSNRN